MESQVKVVEEKSKIAMRFIIKDLVKNGLIVVACISFFILIILDISPVVKALKNDYGVMSEFMRKGLPEFQRVRSCNNNEPVSNGFSAGWRQCALKAFKEVNSPLMVKGAAGISILWLEEHPEDVEIRDAAQEMIHRSRAKMVEDRPSVYARIERLDRALNGSVIAGAMGISNNQDSLFDKSLMDLNLVELGLFNPKEFARQESWMAKMRAGIL
jgi:hypothetical protein